MSWSPSPTYAALVLSLVVFWPSNQAWGQSDASRDDLFAQDIAIEAGLGIGRVRLRLPEDAAEEAEPSWGVAPRFGIGPRFDLVSVLFEATWHNVQTSDASLNRDWSQWNVGLLGQADFKIPKVPLLVTPGGFAGLALAERGSYITSRMAVGTSGPVESREPFPNGIGVYWGGSLRLGFVFKQSLDAQEVKARRAQRALETAFAYDFRCVGDGKTKSSEECARLAKEASIAARAMGDVQCNEPEDTTVSEENVDEWIEYAQCTRDQTELTPRVGSLDLALQLGWSRTRKINISPFYLAGLVVRF